MTGFALQVTLLVTGVVAARALGPEDRGYLATFTLVGALAWQLGPFGFPYALSYAAAQVPGSAHILLEQATRFLRRRALLATVAGGGTLVLLLAGDPGRVWVGAAVALLAIAPTVFQQASLAILQGLQRFSEFNWLRLAPNGAFAILALALLALGRTSLIELTLAWTVSRSAFVVLSWRRAQRSASSVRIESGPDEPSEQWLRRFGRRAFLGGSPPLETFRLDQAAAALFLAPTALGLYISALALSNLPRFIAQGVGMVAVPVVAASESAVRARSRMWSFAWASIPLAVAVVLPLWLAAPALVEFFFGPEFIAAGEISQVLLLATAAYCVRRIITDASRGAGYPGIGSVAEAVAALSVIPLFALFIDSHGEIGIAYAMAISSAISLLVLILGLVWATRRPGPSQHWIAQPEARATAQQSSQ